MWILFVFSKMFSRLGKSALSRPRALPAVTASAQPFGAFAESKIMPGPSHMRFMSSGPGQMGSYTPKYELVDINIKTVCIFCSSFYVLMLCNFVSPLPAPISDIT
jgi:hypothetical protein